MNGITVSEQSRWLELDSLLDIALLAISRVTPGRTRALFLAPSNENENDYIIYTVGHIWNGKGDGTSYFYFTRIDYDPTGHYLEIVTDSRNLTSVKFTDFVDESPRKKILPLVRLKKQPDFL